MVDIGYLCRVFDDSLGWLCLLHTLFIRSVNIYHGVFDNEMRDP